MSDIKDIDIRDTAEVKKAMATLDMIETAVAKSAGRFDDLRTKADEVYEARVEQLAALHGVDISKAHALAVDDALAKRAYTNKKTKQIKVPSVADMVEAFKSLGLSQGVLLHEDGSPTDLAALLHAYFEHRAKVLNEHVEPRLMDAARAKKEFDRLREELKVKGPFRMNQQKGEKKAEAYLTNIVNMLVQANCGDAKCDFNPGTLTTFTRDGIPVRTLARRVDGAFPAVVNPVAVWEIKEYYYTTTFGSRVADGVYESLLDGLELEELREHEKIDAKHYLMVDAHYTWWACGRPYLCRMVDILHMGYVDEILFGYEVIEEMPRITKELVQLLKAREPKKALAS